MVTAIEVLIATGRLLNHLRGAWRCTCEIAVILGNETILDPDPGF